MADNDNQPTEEQIQEANAQEEAKWADDFTEDQLDVPYDNTDDTDNADDSDNTDNNEEEAEEPEAPVEEYEEPEPAVTVENPGDYTPKDYSFKVTLADGKTRTISTPEEADKIAEDADNFETPAQLMDFIRKSQKMENSLEKDREKYEEDKAKYDEQLKSETERRETVNAIANEFEYLESKGLLPPTPAQYKNADWSDPDVAKQPGVVEKIELLNYMVRENEARAKAGVQPLTSVIDALNAFEADEDRQTKETERKESGERRKAAGSRVAGVSPSRQSPYVPKGIAVGNPNILKRGAAQWDD